MTSRLESEPHRAVVFARARRIVDRWGGVGVFLSTWLFSPLGPYVNLLASVMRMGWARFSFSDTVGEAIWIGVYVGLGYAFSSRIAQLADLLGNSIVPDRRGCHHLAGGAAFQARAAPTEELMLRLSGHCPNSETSTLFLCDRGRHFRHPEARHRTGTVGFAALWRRAFQFWSGTS
ncbi:MAG: hypothetical protein MEQ74_13450 [Paracoccus sp.]|nr:hypothetical protein [Paracoccus sp. (in: a-proteobacteria)]